MNQFIKIIRMRCGPGWILPVVILIFSILLQGCSSPTLKPWHRAKLTAEFNASMTDEVRTFDDYLQLENKLFAELEEKVYAKTGTGPEYSIVRYSTGSLADPQHRQSNWNRSFELNAAAPRGGVLLLHGMSDSPYSLRALGETLNQRGYMVIGLRLPGHGTAPSGLRAISWQDMSAAVRLAIKHLSAKVGAKPIHMIGYSTGAPLALDFVLNVIDGNGSPMPASLVLISPAIGIHPAAGLAGFRNWLGHLPGLGSLAWLSVMLEFDPYKYNSFATNAGSQVHRLTRSVSNRLAAKARSGPIKAFPPILVFKSQVDATVSTDAVVDSLLVRLASGSHELVTFDINHLAVEYNLIQSDPRLINDRLMARDNLPFTVTLVTNENSESTKIIARRKKSLSNEISIKPLNLDWPQGYISLSHVALPFPPDDPLYGMHNPQDPKNIFLGLQSIQGERGLLVLPPHWLLRLRHNPFYDYLEERTIEWVDSISGLSG
ncbi:MAG: alpha/beta hydrolase [Desulfobulbaceae bacterium]